MSFQEQNAALALVDSFKCMNMSLGNLKTDTRKSECNRYVVQGWATSGFNLNSGFFLVENIVFSSAIVA